MFASRISVKDMNERLDAEYFTPDFIDADHRILDHARADSVFTLEQLRKKQAGLCYGVLQPRFIPKGIPAIEIAEIKSLVATHPKRYITIAQHNEYSRSEVQPGDLLISVKGTLGVVGIAGSDYPISNVNRDIARLRVSESKVDSYFLCAFFNSDSGNLSLQRIARGTVQRNLNISDLLEHRVYVPSPLAQTYIGDKVRQTERLRARARELEENSRSNLRKTLGNLGYTETSFKKTYRAKLSERLDPAYYNPQFTSVLAVDWFKSNSQPLSDFLVDGSYGVLPNSATYGIGTERLLRATDLDACVEDSEAGIRVPLSECAQKAKVIESDLLLEVKGAIERCVLAKGHVVGTYVNGSVFRFQSKNIPVGYLTLYLQGPIKQLYCRRAAANNIIQYLSLDSIHLLPVVRIGALEEENISKAFLLAQDLKTNIWNLTTAAKLLVEALIEGQVSEADLVAAQKALEAGDRTVDRKILSRLTRKGMDIAGEPPLFPDLDGLYQALDGLGQPEESP